MQHLVTSALVIGQGVLLFVLVENEGHREECHVIFCWAIVQASLSTTRNRAAAAESRKQIVSKSRLPDDAHHLKVEMVKVELAGLTLSTEGHQE
jgi:hypothetical protein